MSNVSVTFITETLLIGYRYITQSPDLVWRRYSEDNREIGAKCKFGGLRMQFIGELCIWEYTIHDTLTFRVNKKEP